MAYLATISSSGQITLPKAERVLLGVKPGDQVVLDRIEGVLTIKSRRQELENTFSKLKEMREKYEKEHPESKELREKYADMTFSEVRDTYDATPEGRKEFKERYGLDIK